MGAAKAICQPTGRFRAGYETQPTEFRIEITPLIDVIFQLLIFFLLTTSFITERALEVELPRADAAQKSRERKRIVAVTVTREGELAHDGRRVTSAQLSAVLARAAAADREQVVVIRGDHAVSHGRIVEVMDLARLHGLTKLAIATAPNPDTVSGK